jgi:hypothetical protein
LSGYAYFPSKKAHAAAADAVGGGGCARGEGAREGVVGGAGRGGAAVGPARARRGWELSASLAAADVHLLSVRSPWQGLIVPSKLQAAFGLGRPVVYVGPSDSEPAEWVLEATTR